jgi:uncharacterized protein YegP (UPF0339 family)
MPLASNSSLEMSEVYTSGGIASVRRNCVAERVIDLTTQPVATA